MSNNNHIITVDSYLVENARRRVRECNGGALVVPVFNTSEEFQQNQEFQQNSKAESIKHELRVNF